MTQFMTSSFVKVMFSLIREVPVCFFPVVENVLTQMYIQLAARSKYQIVFLPKKTYSTGCVLANTVSLCAFSS